MTEKPHSGVPIADLRTAVEHALDRVLLMVRDLDGCILLWTKADEEFYGWTAAEALGHDADELLRTQFPVSRAIVEHELLTEGEWRGEVVRHHRDGRTLPVISHKLLHRGQDGTPQVVLQFCHDLSGARRAQSMIEEREARLRSVLETAPDAIITIDETGIVQSFSQAAERLFGYAAGEVVGENVRMLMAAPHAEAHDGYLARYLATGEKRIIGIGRQVDARRKDGTLFPMELAVGEVKLAKGRIFTGFIRDISARAAMEAELRQGQRMEAVGQLTGGVSHDFNNLLTVISGNLEMLEGRLKSADDLELLREAQEATALGAQLASRLLAFGRRQPLRPVLVDVNMLVQGMAGLLQRSLGETITIDLRLAPDLPRTLADPGQLENVLLNLAINARDAMPGGGRLTIATGLREVDAAAADRHPDAAPGRYVQLSVSDTGVGMAPEVRERAFEPFFTTKAVGVGSGLGLSMVYGFVRQSGGHVHLDSQLGVGTTVILCLPEDRESPLAATAAASSPAAVGASGETVLVVEDDSRVRRVTVRRLRELGYEVVEADSGDAALALLEGGAAADILFTDVVMPGELNGPALALAARRLRPSIRVLLTSGYTDPETLAAVADLPGAGWLPKPYLIDVLRDRLAELKGA
jgi:PAS domain S-box-containing protein